MAEQVKVRSVSSISEDYLRVIRYLEEAARQRVAVNQGNYVQHEHGLLADITDIKQLHDALPTGDIDSQIDKVQGSDMEVGALGDLQSLAIQSDTVARFRRMCASRYADRRQRRLQSTYRYERHGTDSGYWIAYRLNRLQNIQKRMLS